MCELSDAELCWVRTKIRSNPELRQFDIGISTKRYFPAKGTAGFERFSVKGWRRVPFPPPNTTEMTSFAMMFYTFPSYHLTNIRDFCLTTAWLCCLRR